MTTAAMPAVSEYKLRAKLKDVGGAIGVLTFSKDGKLLLSGGDDECVRVWSTDTFMCQQVLCNTTWGQVTALTWVHVESAVDESVSVCVGTGRGTISLCPMSDNPKHHFSCNDTTVSFPFDLNDAVEEQAFDSLNRRLAVSSHSGQIKMFKVDGARLTQIWNTNISNAIPRGLLFYGRENQNLLVHGLETGEMSCRDAQTSDILWVKVLKGGIGNAVLSPNGTQLLVDNLTTSEFDIYPFPASTPSISFSSSSTRCFIKQCIFGEGARVAICGSARGQVQVVNVKTGKCIQLLQSNEENMIQFVDTTADAKRHLIAGGSTGSIYIWEKRNMVRMPKLGTAPPSEAWPTDTKQMVINTLFAAIMLFVSYPNWSTYFWKLVANASITLAAGANYLANFSSAAVAEAIPRADVMGIARHGVEEVVSRAESTIAAIVEHSMVAHTAPAASSIIKEGVNDIVKDLVVL